MAPTGDGAEVAATAASSVQARPRYIFFAVSCKLLVLAASVDAFRPIWDWVSLNKLNELGAGHGVWWVLSNRILLGATFTFCSLVGSIEASRWIRPQVRGTGRPRDLSRIEVLTEMDGPDDGFSIEE